MNRSNALIAIALAAGAACGATAASAQSAATQPAPPADDTIRLTDEQRMAIIDSNTEESAAAARGELTGSGNDGRVHGEMAAMIGSQGTRGVFAAADIPLGDHAEATVSYENTRYGYRYRR